MATILFPPPQLCPCFLLPSHPGFRNCHIEEKSLGVKEKGGGHDQGGKGKPHVTPASAPVHGRPERSAKTFATICTRHPVVPQTEEVRASGLAGCGVHGRGQECCREANVLLFTEHVMCPMPVSPLYRKGSGGSENLRRSPKITQPARSNVLKAQAPPYLLPHSMPGSCPSPRAQADTRRSLPNCLSPRRGPWHPDRHPRP